MIGIYSISNKINNKVYIGLSTDIKARWSSHRHNLRGERRQNNHLQNSWNKYGEENFEFKVIEECEENLLSEREQYYIKKYKSYNPMFGYNKTFGGETFSYTDEQKIKLSDISMLKIPVVKLDVNGVVLKRYDSAVDAAKDVNGGTTNIGRCCKGSAFSHKGYQWCFNEELKDHINMPLPAKIRLTPIYQMDLDGNIIDEFDSIADALRAMNLKYNDSHISACCNKKRKSCCGFLWIHQLDYNSINVDNMVLGNKSKTGYDKKRPVIQLDIVGNKIKEFDSVREAANILDIKRRYIDNCCKGSISSYNNMKFMYKVGEEVA